MIYQYAGETFIIEKNGPVHKLVYRPTKNICLEEVTILEEPSLTYAANKLLKKSERLYKVKLLETVWQALGLDIGSNIVLKDPTTEGIKKSTYDSLSLLLVGEVVEFEVKT